MKDLSISDLIFESYKSIINGAYVKDFEQLMYAWRKQSDGISLEGKKVIINRITGLFVDITFYAPRNNERYIPINHENLKHPAKILFLYRLESLLDQAGYELVNTNVFNSIPNYSYIELKRILE